jgi:hypothetical protein
MSYIPHVPHVVSRRMRQPVVAQLSGLSQIVVILFDSR